jgi:PIN domain nuclease of toxin-antitoxin system
MSYLLDTNALIGLLFCPDILSEDANRIMQESEELSVSIASLCELGIKQSIGKIDIDASAADITDACKKLDVSILAISPEHIDRMRILPLIHRDPFDRIIIAQAITEDMVLITKDNIIPQYKEVEILW